GFFAAGFFAAGFFAAGFFAAGFFAAGFFATGFFAAGFSADDSFEDFTVLIDFVTAILFVDFFSLSLFWSSDMSQ
ncbi:MAG: hypothetical protein ACJ0QM_06025, partial [Schleiferiaceae bacterium]